MSLFGKELNGVQLERFHGYLTNNDVDFYELLFIAVSCEQFDAVKIILNSGFEINSDIKRLRAELFICSQYEGSKHYVDLYLANGLTITSELLTEINLIAQENSNHFEIERTYQFIAELSGLISTN